MKRSRCALMLQRTEMSAKGFTLLEVLVATAIGTVVIFALYLSFSSVLGGRSSIEARAERSRKTARFVDAFTNEVQSAYLSDSNKATFFRGDMDNGELPTGRVEFTTIVYQGPGEQVSGDISAVRYSAARDEKGRFSLYKEVWNPYGTGKEPMKVEVMEDILGFDLLFYNGQSWSAAWDGKLENRTPEAVRATVKILDKGAGKEVRAFSRTFVR